MRIDNNIGQQAPKQENKVPLEVTIHDVHILDSSGSMNGAKYNSAIKGINADIVASKETLKSTKGLTNTLTIVEFDSKIKTHMLMEPIQTVSEFTSRLMGDMTALYQAIGETIEKLIISKNPDDKVLMKIFTDGGENASRGKWTNSVLANLIELAETKHNFTITFVGTKTDVRDVINNLKIKESNTLVHDNTGKGVADSFGATVMAKTSYIRGAMAGEDVSSNFYTKSL